MNEHAHDIAREFAQLLRERLGGHVKQIILFGSRARGDARKGSDYNVLVVDERSKELREEVLDIDVEMINQHKALMGSILCNEEEWRRMGKFPIGWNINKEGVAL